MKKMEFTIQQKLGKCYKTEKHWYRHMHINRKKYQQKIKIMPPSQYQLHEAPHIYNVKKNSQKIYVCYHICQDTESQGQAISSV